jgi:hypothetical protein
MGFHKSPNVWKHIHFIPFAKKREMVTNCNRTIFVGEKKREKDNKKS